MWFFLEIIMAYTRIVTRRKKLNTHVSKSLLKEMKKGLNFTVDMLFAIIGLNTLI